MVQCTLVNPGVLLLWTGMTQVIPTLPSGETPKPGTGGTGFSAPSLCKFCYSFTHKYSKLFIKSHIQYFDTGKSKKEVVESFVHGISHALYKKKFL